MKTRDSRKPGPGRPRHLDSDQPDRRFDLVRAAYEIIASDGFENLRTRDVAERAGVNIATLHYYYPTKEALIGGVAHYLAKQFETQAEPPPGDGALQKLRHEFVDMRFYLAKRPDMIEVMRELNARARRDSAIVPIIQPLKAHWRKSLEHIVAAGIAEGVFRSDLDASKAAAVILAMLWGGATLPLDATQREYLFESIEFWLNAGSSGTENQREPKRRDRASVPSSPSERVRRRRNQS